MIIHARFVALVLRVDHPAHGGALAASSLAAGLPARLLWLGLG